MNAGAIAFATRPEIKQAALDEGIQIQELMRRAIDAWMEQNGSEAVAAVARRRANQK